MDTTMSRLLECRDTFFRGLELAAKERNLGMIQTFQSKLERVEKLIRQLEDVNRETCMLVDSDATESTSVLTAGVTDRVPTHKEETPSSKKARGRRHRDAFLRKLHTVGGALEPVKGKNVIYRMPRGELVGISYASEGKKNNKHRWFLGLNEKVDHVVLLCETEDGQVVHFSLPRTFMNQHWKNVSRDQGGQFKFTVLRRDRDFYLHLTGVKDPVSIEPFRDNFSGLA